MKILLTNKTYDILKWVCLIGLPAVAALIAALGDIWGLPNVSNIVLTINAVGVFLGALIGISTSAYYKKEARNDEG